MVVRVLEGDARSVLTTLPSESVHCVVTSPPYYGLRDYGTALWDGGDAECDHKNTNTWRGEDSAEPNKIQRATPMKHECSRCGATRIDSQLGLEATPAEYIASMVAVFREVRRVLRKDGTLWLNIGDSYQTTSGGGQQVAQTNTGAGLAANRSPARITGLKPKDLIGIPWMLAFALREDGWYLRSDIIWSKPNPMPESVTDRPTKAHEYLFLLTKSARYYYDADAIREPHESADDPRNRTGYEPLRQRNVGGRTDGFTRAAGAMTWGEGGRNKRSVWEIATEPFPEAHFATYPTALVEPCIKAGTSEKGCCPECGAPWARVVSSVPRLGVARPAEHRGGIGTASRLIGGQYQKWMDENPSQTTGWRPTCAHDLEPRPCTVLDPFMGAGTTLLVADRLNRDGIGIELNPTYAAMARNRLVGDAPMFVELAV